MENKMEATIIVFLDGSMEVQVSGFGVHRIL